MGRDLSNSLFSKYSRLVYQQCGINLHEGKKTLLQARLNKRLRLTGFPTYEDYYRHITQSENGSELVHFLDAISTNLTYFFREPQHFDLLHQSLLDPLIEVKKRQGTNRIRIWSAACSTGEEPYTLAMCVLPHLEDLKRWDFRILATDISTRVLQICAKGLYSKEKLQKVPANLRRTYFRQAGNGSSEYEVIPLLKQVVSVRYLNLQAPFPFSGPFDYIFCRNVLIYFDKPTQEALINKMTQYLAPGACLFIGHSESLTGLKHSLTYVKPAVYRK